MTATEAAAASVRGIRSLVPARVDRLGWSRFHTRTVVALGVAWILDGLEVSIAGNVCPYLTDPGTLGLGTGSVAFSVGTVYLDLTRFIAGAGIGGEYAAINSAVDELIPARHRGRVDIAVSETYWAAAFLAAVRWIGYLIGAAVMIIGARVELWLGVDAENRALEDIATPLTAVDDPGEPSGVLADPTGAPRPPTA